MVDKLGNVSAAEQPKTQKRLVNDSPVSKEVLELFAKSNLET